MTRRYKLYLRDILSEIDRIEEFISSVCDEEAFLEDERTAYAVARSIEIIGEAAKNVPDEVLQQASQVPWHQIRRMRDHFCVRSNSNYGPIDKEIWRCVPNRCRETSLWHFRVERNPREMPEIGMGCGAGFPKLELLLCALIS